MWKNLPTFRVEGGKIGGKKWKNGMGNFEEAGGGHVGGRI